MISFTDFFSMGYVSEFKINLSIFLRFWENIRVFPCSLSFSVMVICVSMERLHANNFAAAFYGIKVFLSCIFESQNYFRFITKEKLHFPLICIFIVA